MLARLITRCSLVGMLVAGVPAAELQFDFSRDHLHKTPPDFVSVLGGTGEPGDWKILWEDVPPLLPPLTPAADRIFKKGVLVQNSRDATDERFPMLIYDKETFGDFTLSTRFKLVEGEKERMAGLAFRWRDVNNYYYIRASGLGRTFYFYKVVDGVRSAPIGNPMEISSGVWHTLAVECKGTKIRALLNGQEVIPTLTDHSFASGKVGFWTKSDAVTYFSEARIQYTPRESLAEVLVREGLKKYDRLVGLKIVVIQEGTDRPVILASDRAEDVGQPGWAKESEVISTGTIYHLKEKKVVSVSMPLRNRNGIPVAAARVVMKHFPGQTEKNALARARNVVRTLEARIMTVDRL